MQMINCISGISGNKDLSRLLLLIKLVNIPIEGDMDRKLSCFNKKAILKNGFPALTTLKETTVLCLSVLW